jgi:putative Holliday junction resolvase
MVGDRDEGAGTPRRVLGIDLGERRIGVAVGDVDAGVATPLTTLNRGRSIAQDALVISRLASEQRAAGLVVGLPLDMDGGEGQQAIRTREWAVAVGDITGLPVRFRDERLSSERAERRVGLPARGRSGGPPTAAQRDGHRARIDREAAVLILQDELDAKVTENGSQRPDDGS